MFYTCPTCGQSTSVKAAVFGPNPSTRLPCAKCSVSLELSRDGNDKITAKRARNFFADSGAKSKTKAEAQSDSFFTSGRAMADIDFKPPEIDKHKPSKEEYASMLQEFSVMFRLDKRTKRQNVAMVTVLAAAAIGVVTFGILLKLDGDRKQALLHDTRTMLAVFSLDYQTSETIDVARDKAEELPAAASGTAQDRAKKAAEGSGAADAAPAVVAATPLSNQLVRRIRAQPKVAVVKDPGPPKLSPEDQKRLDDAMEIYKSGGKDRPAGPVVGVERLSKAELKKTCQAHLQDLHGCVKKHADGESAIVWLKINLAGHISGVRGDINGKEVKALTECAWHEMKLVHFAPQPEEINYPCTVESD